MLKKVKEMEQKIINWGKSILSQMDEYDDDYYTFSYLIENIEEFTDCWVLVDSNENPLDLIYEENLLTHKVFSPHLLLGTKSIGFLKANYPEAFISLNNYVNPEDNDYEIVDMTSHLDSDHTLAIMGGNLWKLKSNNIDIVAEWESSLTPSYNLSEIKFETLSYEELMKKEFSSHSEIFAKTWSESGNYLLYGFHYLSSVESPDNVTFYVAYCENTLIGCIKVYEKSDHYTIGFIDVHIAYRNKGIAKDLIKFIGSKLSPEKKIILTSLSKMGERCHIDECFKRILNDFQILTYEEAVYGRR